MTKEELIETLLNSEVGLQDEILISIEDQAHYEAGSMPIIVSIDFVGGQFINVTIT